MGPYAFLSFVKDNGRQRVTIPERARQTDHWAYDGDQWQRRYAMELSGRQIQDRRFASALRGYDRAEVDTFCAEVGGYTGALEERLRIAEVRAASNDEELATLRGEIDTLLSEATEARRKIIEEAREEATVITAQAATIGESVELADAATRATAVLSEADTTAGLRIEDAEHLRAVAQEDAAQLVQAAKASTATTQAEADRLLDKARLDANLIRRDAESVRASMEAQVAEIRRILEAARTKDAEFDEVAASRSVDRVKTEVIVGLRGDAKDPETHSASG